MTKEELEYKTLDYDEQFKSEPWYVGCEVETDDHGPHLALSVRRGMVRPKIKSPDVTVKVCIYLVDE